MKILILRAAGINCDEETAAAVRLAGGTPERVHVNRLAAGEVALREYAGLIIPGGFSYGDHLGAGKLLAVDLMHRLGDAVRDFVAQGRPVLGICNGFQVLVKTGLLGTDDSSLPQQTVTLTDNASGHYECRWTRLAPVAGTTCAWVRDLPASFALPVGHGEGRLLADDATLDRLAAQGQVALHYINANAEPTEHYPANPNGAARGIAGLCNRQGNVLGLMPHPDRAFLPHLHPDWARNKQRTHGDGLALFRNFVHHAHA